MRKIKPLFRPNLADVEFFELFDEQGNSIGKMRPRHEVHRKGYLHGASHIWIIEKDENGKYCVLVQKRSDDKDSFPGCYDCSSAGHVDAHETFEQAAVRELREELAVEATEDDLEFMFMQTVHGENVFHGKPFINNEVNKVYLLKKPVDIEQIVFEPREISAVEWQDLEEVLKILENGDDGPETGYCMWKDEVRRVYEYVSAK